jgi:hypothetical protein
MIGVKLTPIPHAQLLVSLLVLFVMIGLGWMTTRRWWLHQADVEQIRGLVVLLLVASSMVVAAVMLLANRLSPTVRVAWLVGTVAVALGAASTEWTRRTLRWTGALALVLVSLLVLDIGRDQLALDPATDAVEELEGMVTVLDALADPASTRPIEPDRVHVEEAIAEACAAAKLVGIDAEDIPDAVPCDIAAPTDTLAVSLAIARLRLASYRLAVLGREEDSDAVKASTAALADAQATAGAEGEIGATVVDAFRAGGEAILRDLPGQRKDFPLTIEVLGWTLLAALVLAGWRTVERRSGQQMAGPVTINAGTAEPGAEKAATGTANSIKDSADTAAESVGASSSTTEPPVGTKEDGAEAQRTMLRTALLQNIPEPTAAPGSDALSSITDLAELGGGAATALTKIAGAVVGIIKKPGGFLVTSDVIAPRSERDRWSVLIRISDQTTGEQLAVQSLSGDSASATCRAAGYWAAADILSRSSRIPGWASWSPDAAESLAAYHDADRLSSPDLEKALARAPTSGLLLNELGNRCEFAGRHLDALVLYARCVAVHPRYFVGRYRMAASLAMLLHDLEAEWFGAPMSKRVSVTGALIRVFARLKLDGSDLAEGHGVSELPGMNDPAVTEAMLEQLTLRLLDRLESDTSRVQLLARALRRSERVIWWPRMWSTARLFGAAARDEWLVRSARAIEDARDISKVESRALNPHSWWQLSYNLACHYARRGETERAQDWLEVALERPGSGQMADAWLEKDPDLQKLHGTPQFEWVVAQVRAK